MNVNAKGGVTQRLMRGFGATALGPVLTAMVQLVAVPLLLHIWGAAKYGDWLLLSAVPSYLTFSDLGFGDASASDMSVRVTTADREAALDTFQSSWILVITVSLGALLLTSAIVWSIPWQAWLRLSSLSNFEATKVILVLGAYVAVSQQNGVVESGFRSDGHFATGTFMMVIQRLVETVAATTVALVGGSLMAVACTYLILRCLGTMSYSLLLRRLSPWIHFGIRHARFKTIKRLAAPAFGFMALPIGYALNLQGLILVIGATLGPIGAVSFSTLRTLARLNSQLTSSLKNALWPELSRAFGERNIALARRLHRFACQAALGLSIFGGLLLWIFGPFIYRLWLPHGVVFDATCFHVLLLVAVTNSLWDTSSVIPMSINAHCRIAISYSVVAAISVGIAWMLATPLGTAGVAVALLATDVCMTLLVVRTSLHHVQDDFRKFVLAMFTIPKVRHQTLQATKGYDMCRTTGVVPSVDPREPGL